ncbi:uncharacterized protein LOC130900759 [Diorhabda carinulata]|uniref:uncharacterized protein LOC130900759 n=1 Tax=Diorhabda carinulata TaxID=1163345 RepID=UPI0025A16571|nr:uncharacterized protein LOC130900759 [Diorhabda carinulata]
MKKLVLASFILLFATIQYINGDEKLQNCARKLVDKIKQFDPFSRPSCINDYQLQQIKTYFDAVEAISDKIPEKCKAITSDNIGECLQIVRNTFVNQSNEINQAAAQGFQIMSNTLSECFKQMTNKFSNLNEYVLNGCE